jgi:hypothetical protein
MGKTVKIFHYTMFSLFLGIISITMTAHVICSKWSENVGNIYSRKVVNMEQLHNFD